jgi:hypothetical protein
MKRARLHMGIPSLPVTIGVIVITAVVDDDSPAKPAWDDAAVYDGSIRHWMDIPAAATKVEPGA